MSENEITKGINRKIKTGQEVVSIIGEFPRKKSVVLCHGVFDILHPGHLRHLMYAKERGDLLIAAVVSDQHISNLNNQSFVPQEIRAMNVAALEFVDFVLIDQSALPADTIIEFKPDIFAKGYVFDSESEDEDLTEQQALNSYGGELLLTPGDTTSLPMVPQESTGLKLSAAKLLILMQAEGIEFEDLRKALKLEKEFKINIIGDSFIEEYTHCNPTGGITKSPTISVVVKRETHSLGGAAKVAEILSAAGISTTLITVLGEDPQKEFILVNLKKAGVNNSAIVDPTRPTCVRNTYLGKNHHLLRVNTFDSRIISNKVNQSLVTAISNNLADGYVFCDYRFGIFASNTISSLVEAVPKDRFKAADSQVASRWGNVLEFADFDLITPNEREARFAVGDQDSVVRPLALEIYSKARCKLLLMKLGDRGIIAYRAPNPDPKSFFTVDSFAEKVVNATGAGDALLAYSTLGMLTSKSEVISAILGSLAAAVSCEQQFRDAVKPSDVIAKINRIEQTILSSNSISVNSAVI